MKALAIVLIVVVLILVKRVRDFVTQRYPYTM